MRDQRTLARCAYPMALLLLFAAAHTNCARPLGSWFAGDNNNVNGNFSSNSNGNLNDNSNGNLNDTPVNDPPVAMCPGDVTTEPGRPVDLIGDGYDDHGIVGWDWAVLSAPSDSTAAPSPTDARDTTFNPDAEGDYVLRLTVMDDSGLSSSCQMNVFSRMGTPLAICMENLIMGEYDQAPLYGNAVDNGYILVWTWEITAHTGDTDPIMVNPNDQTVLFEPRGRGMIFIRLTVEDNDGLTNWCEFYITTGTGPPTAICPEDIDTVSQVSIDWQGDAVDDGLIHVWQWEMISTPTGSSAAPPSPATSPAASFTPDIVGEYRMKLTVTDAMFFTDSCEFSIFALDE